MDYFEIKYNGEKKATSFSLLLEDTPFNVSKDYGIHCIKTVVGESMLLEK